MLELLSGFVGELRNAGLPISLTEHLDAARAVHHVPMEDREALKAALGATLVKSGAHWPAFETAFEVYFALRTGPGAFGDEGDPGTPAVGAVAGGGGAQTSAEELAALLLRVMRHGDRALAAALARAAVDRHAGMEPGRPVGGTYYL
jgi:uncharacterized protein